MTLWFMTASSAFHLTSKIHHSKINAHQSFIASTLIIIQTQPATSALAASKNISSQNFISMALLRACLFPEFSKTSWPIGDNSALSCSRTIESILSPRVVWHPDRQDHFRPITLSFRALFSALASAIPAMSSNSGHLLFRMKIFNVSGLLSFCKHDNINFNGRW